MAQEELVTYGFYKIISNRDPFVFPGYSPKGFPRNVILGWIPYLAIVIGWTYLAVVVAFHFLKRRVKSKNWIFNGFLGWILFTVAFLFYWLDDYGTSYGTNNLLEGLIVYLVLGFVMNILYHLPMWESKQGNT